VTSSSAERYFAWLLRHRWIVLATAGLVVTAAGFSALGIRADYDVEQFFKVGDPARQVYEDFGERFPREDRQVTLFWDIGEPLDLRTYRQMEQAAEWFAEAGLVDVIWAGNAEVADQTLIEGENALRIHRLVEPDSLDAEYLARVLDRYRRDALYEGIRWNAAQTVFTVQGYLEERENNDANRRRVEEMLSARLATLDAAGRTWVLGGVPIARSRVLEALSRDQRLLLGGGLLLFFGILYVFLRCATQVSLCLAAILPAYVVTLGIMAWADAPMTVLTSFVPIIVLVVGASDAIHVLNRFREEQTTGASRPAAIVRAFADLLVPCFYTSLTTALGFAALISTRVDIVVAFALSTTAAIVLTFVFSMTLFPVLLSFGGMERARRRLGFPWLDLMLARAVSMAARPRWRVVALFAALGTLGLAAGSQMRVNSYMIDDLRSDQPIVRDLRWIEHHGFGVFEINLFLRQDGDLPWHHPDNLAWMERFQRWAERDPLVIKTIALPDFIKPLRQAILDGSDSTRILPASAAEASQLLLLASLQDASFVEAVYHQHDGDAQVMMTVRDEGSVATIPFLDRIDSYLVGDPPPGGSGEVTGTVRMAQSVFGEILQSFGLSLALAGGLIFLVITYMLRSWRWGFVTLLANVFPMFVVAGAMKLGGFDLKPSSILVFAVAFGIAVDDTIHLVGRVRTGLRDGQGMAGAVQHAVRESGRAIVITTFVVAAGFSLLLFSQFESLFLLGSMTIVSAAAALAADLYMLPALLTLVASGQRYASAGAVNEWETS